MPNGAERRDNHKVTVKAAIKGTAPRVAPAKVWDSDKPPGGKIPEKSK